ncbi:hypothetical protein [Methanofollis ethanolicus]|uniref:hypothetical protein n=1 Tax=Methanofollis ethanolicus TaxID=488124 RepID=UPI00128EE04B|nr:hypothetical protein [Methanofollis ethanolicus]
MKVEPAGHGGPDTPAFASKQGISHLIRGHREEIRRSGCIGVRARNRMKSGRTQRLQAAVMIAGNICPSRHPLVPGRRREWGRKMPGSGLWRYSGMRVYHENDPDVQFWNYG